MKPYTLLHDGGYRSLFDAEFPKTVLGVEIGEGTLVVNFDQFENLDAEAAWAGMIPDVPPGDREFIFTSGEFI